jgi:transcription factor-like protein
MERPIANSTPYRHVMQGRYGSIQRPEPVATTCLGTMLTSVGSMRRRESRCAMHQLYCIWHRVSYPNTQAEEDPIEGKGWGRVRFRWLLRQNHLALTSHLRSDRSRSPITATNSPVDIDRRDRSSVFTNSVDGTPSVSLSEAYAAHQSTHNGTYAQFMKPKFARAPIKEAGRVAYLGESSNLSLLVHDRYGASDVVHYPLPENVRGAKARVNELDNMEIEILHQRGAFLLPPRALCDELIEAFFKWVAPVVPVINKSRFMRQYRDPKNPPSLLLLQAILLAGSRVCTNPQLMDSSGSTTPAAMTFYKRAKALFDANYEDDRVTIVQALLLLAWYWEGPEGSFLCFQYILTPISSLLDVTKNVFYWTRVAIVVAQGSGMHRRHVLPMTLKYLSLTFQQR